MTRAYPYLRYSSDAQGKGYSLERQILKARAYAQKHGLELCDPILDEGVSAFDGSNLARGALSKFVDDATAGRVPSGSLLLIESFDRFSRQTAFVALGPFSALLNAGMTIVTLTDERAFSFKSMTTTNALNDLLFSLMSMERANQESLIKSIRSRDSWKHKRAGASDKKLTARCPAWLRLDESRKSFSIIEDKAKVVCEIFDWTIAGDGKHQIARRLNERGVPPFAHGKSWHASYIGKVIANRAVIGEFQPRTKVEGPRAPIGEPISDYYPRVVSVATFAEAYAARAARNLGYAGRKGRQLPNLFSGLCRCGVCSGGMTFRAKGNGEDYLTCDSALRGRGCASRTHFNYKSLENGVLDEILGISIDFDTQCNAEVTALTKSRLAEVGNEISKRETAIGNIVESLETGVSKALASRVQALEAEIDRLKIESADLNAQLLIQTGSPSLAQITESVESLRNDIESPDDIVRRAARGKVFQGLHSIIDFISFEPEGRKAYVAIVGGAIAMLFSDGAHVRTIDLTPQLDRYGGVPTAAITGSNARNQGRLKTLLNRMLLTTPVSDCE